MKISQSAKAVVGAVGTITTALNAAFADDVLSVDEAGHVISVTINAGITVWAIWKVRNKPTGRTIEI